MKKAALLFILCAVLCTSVFADEAMPQFAIPTAAGNGMGGTHVAYTDNVFALLVNPAAIMRVEQRSFFALSPTLLSPQSTFGLLGPMMDAAGGDMDALGDAADILSKQKGKIPLGFDLREFPLSIAWVADGFGFGLWNRVFVNPNIIGTNVEINAYADVILPVGFAFKILDTDAHSVDAGITVKPFVRVLFSEKMKIMEMMDDDFDLADSLSVPLIAGAGFDLGFLYRWNIGLSAGLTLDDIVTRGGPITDLAGGNANATYYVPFSMNLGLAYDFKIGRFWTSAPRFFADMGIAFTFDWRNVTNVFQQDDYQKRNAALDIGMGLQITLFNILNLRLGMSEMLPAVGLGADFGPIEIDLAYYGKELGLEPGQLSAAAVDLTFAVRPGAKKRNWPWTRRSLVGLFTHSEKEQNTDD
jgi:hypothetical protein